MSEHTTPAIAQIKAIAAEIHTAGDQLAPLIDDLELWQTEMETDLLGLRLKMAEWTRALNQAAREMGQ